MVWWWWTVQDKLSFPQDVVVYCAESPDFDINVRDNAGYTPLHEACNRGHLDIAQVTTGLHVFVLITLGWRHGH